MAGHCDDVSRPGAPIRVVRTDTEPGPHRPYDRARDLPRLLPLMAEDVVAPAGEAVVVLVGLLRRALRAERNRARERSWVYDPGRHAALLRAYHHELAALTALSRQHARFCDCPVCRATRLGDLSAGRRAARSSIVTSQAPALCATGPAMPDTLDLLFVYGTLLPADAGLGGRQQRLRLAREAEVMGPGSCAGVLYNLGRYPGLVLPAPPDAVVQGTVLRLSAPARSLAWLDAYEGIVPGQHPHNDYERLRCPVVLAAGGTVEAWVYVYRGAIEGAVPIAGGAWLAR